MEFTCPGVPVTACANMRPWRSNTPAERSPASRRPIFDPHTGEFEEVDIYRRPDLAPGARISGPAVIAEDETSTVISPLFDARIDRFGYIELTRNEA